MNITVGDVHISVDLEKKVCILLPCGANGKTYLSKVLLTLTNHGVINACCLSYNINWTTEDYIREIEKSKYDIIMLDRYNLYHSEKLIKHILSIKDTYVLLDFKQYTNYIKSDGSFGLASIEFSGKEFIIS